MLTRLDIENFRGIKKCTIPDFAKFNILIGKNASGKTTALEAISVASHPTGAPWLMQLSMSRDMPQPSVGSDYALRTYFYGLNLQLIPQIKFWTEGGTHRIVLQAVALPFLTLPKNDSAQLAFPIRAGAETEDVSDLGGIKMEYTDTAGISHVATIELVPQGQGAINISPQGIAIGQQPVRFTGANVRGLGSFYVHARRSTSVGETAGIVTDLYEGKREGELMGAIRAVDDRVRKLQGGVRGGQPVLLVDIGAERLLPINTLGDGFCRMTLIASGLLNRGAKLLVVDDIDSGLHYTSMRAFWPALQRLAGTLDRQVFCSTHNEEMLHYAHEAFSSAPSELAVYRLERGADDTLHAERFDHEMLGTALQAQLELR